ncbi:MAG: HupE/UreJ family protein [Gemmatimonadaceae bacterium]
MDSEFATYFRLGIGHIADLKGYDHILFIVALTAGYAARDWRRLLWLVTAFTLGHSLTLALATLRLVRVHPPTIELLIAATIVFTALLSIATIVRNPHDAASASSSSFAPARNAILYAIAGGFGLIHGLGFSNFLRSILGGEETIVIPLFAFNVGLEIGQLTIVAAVLALGTLVCDVAGLPRRRWVTVLSAAIALVALKMFIERLTALA